MNEYDMKRLALILSIQSEIEGAKLDNKIRENSGTGLTVGFNYESQWFFQKAMELQDLAYKHNEQL